MTEAVPTAPNPGDPEAHWTNPDPAAQPSGAMVMGLPRMVLESRTRMGPDATPEAVADELRAGGVETTAEAVRQVWDEGHA
ncbi:MAG: hypothetical protein K2X82_20355 [Gemmataceae bacterium]|nr:hypothetical protein [Gemmataceae bacterium]